jgi:hypothetical protein
MTFLRPWSRWAIVPALLLAACGCSSAGQREFRSPDAAADALVDALRHKNPARVKQILGPASSDVLSSGDKAADRADLERFLALYKAKHRIESEPGGASTLLVGDDDWPFPVPIVKSGDGYVFDTEAGKDEILNRRIGRNELAVQQVCLAIADAQREYVRLRPMGGDLPAYARTLVSDPGTKNGLYWPTAEGEPPSPLGPLAARAVARGYSASSSSPYYGYHYRLLTAQGPNAPGGAMDYEVNGQLVGGFGIVAYPARYGNSGIMTFKTSHDGVVYQRDLGPDTPKLAQEITRFDPGPEWTKAAETSHVAAGSVEGQ